MGALLGGLGAMAAAVFVFAWTQFWDIHSKLRKELRKDLGLAQGVIWGSRYAPALARLFLDLQKEREAVDDVEEEEAVDDAEEDENRWIDDLAARITRKGFFDRVEEAYELGQTASRLQSSYEQLGADGTRAFMAFFVFVVLLPASSLFALLPGADDQDAYWVAGLTAWCALLVLVFSVAAFFAGRFWYRKASLNRMLDEYES